jgi:hypothetical protein
MIAQAQGEYEEARGLYQQSLEIAEWLGDQSGRAATLHQLGRMAQNQGKYEEARGLYQQSLKIFERLGEQRGRAEALHQLGVLVYEQGDFENALMYMIQAYLLFDALLSPSRALAQWNITKIRSLIGEETFTTQWRTLAGDRPLVAKVAQEGTQVFKMRLLSLMYPFFKWLTKWLTYAFEKRTSYAFEKLLGVVSPIILQGTLEQRQKLAATLLKVPGDAPARRFFGCLAAALQGETPEVGLLEPPFTELWQEFQERLRVSPDELSQQEEGKDG